MPVNDHLSDHLSERFAFVVDTEAEPGDMLSALAELLIDLSEKEAQVQHGGDNHQRGGQAQSKAGQD